MKYILTESQFRLLMEQDPWVLKAASGPQKCGKDAKWCGDNTSSDGGGRVRGEKPMSGKKLKRYNETEFWTNQLLKDVKTLPNYSQRLETIKSQIETMPGKGSYDDKVKLVMNLTDKLNKPSPWWFPNAAKKMIGLQADMFTDGDVIKLVNSKGGFDGFKDYYFEHVIF